MQIEYDCIPCIYRQVLEASRMVSSDQEVIREIMNKFAAMIPAIKMEESAPMIVAKMQNVIKDITGKEDPYHRFKENNINKALELYADVEKRVIEHRDSLLASLIMAAMGNSIDAGVSLEVDIEGNLARAIESEFRYNDFMKFKDRLSNASNILIIADNAGEAVFDRLLIQELNKYQVNIVYAVRDKAVLNDITLKEAKQIAIDKYCKLISSGCETPGIILERANSEFLNIYKQADIVISKGQGNLEGLLGVKREIFFLLKIKCQIVAKKLSSGLSIGDFVFKLC